MRRELGEILARAPEPGAPEPRAGRFASQARFLVAAHGLRPAVMHEPVFHHRAYSANPARDCCAIFRATGGALEQAAQQQRFRFVGGEIRDNRAGGAHP